MNSGDAGAGNAKDGNTSENESLRGYASERSDWARERLDNLLGTVQGGNNKSLDDTIDPVFMGGNISDSMRSSTNRTARTARTTRETRDTTKSSQRESSIAPSVARSVASLDPVFMGGAEEASKSSIFMDENGRPRKVSKKKFFCIGIVVFLIVDAILLGVFLGPRLIKGNSSSLLGSGNGDNEDINDQNIPDGFIPPTDNDFDSPTDDEDSMEDDLAFTRHPDSTEPPVASPTEPPAQSPVQPPIEEQGLTQTKLGRYDVVDSVPHDGDAFTQGLEILSDEKIEIMNKWQPGKDSSLINGALPGTYAVESTGQYGFSTLRIVEVATGTVVQTLDLEEEYFGEGCTYFLNGDNGLLRVVQLTWKENRGFVYRLKVPDTSATSTSTDTQWKLKPIGNFTFGDQTTSTNGWGIVYHPLRDQFIVTDGTKWLHFWKLTETKIKNPDGSKYFTFSMDLVEKVTVRESRSTPSDWTDVNQINEMEWDPYSYGGNTILANKWQSNEIVRIWVGPEEYQDDSEYGNNIFLTASNSIDVGKITHVYDLSGLEALANPNRPGSVLNGIAFVYETEATANEFWVTGKYWPTMYRVRMIDE